MGARVIRRRSSPANKSKEEFRTLAMISGAVALPLALAILLVAVDMRSDLSDWKPIQGMGDEQRALIGWPDLDSQARRAQRRVRLLGYMMDGYTPVRDGIHVEMFILMPEAGHFLHAAHRIPDQMIEVRLAQPQPFRFRKLVWAEGVLVRTEEKRSSCKAWYALKSAAVEAAGERDITHWFTP